MTLTPADVPAIELNSGHRIPQLGFGVYKVDAHHTERIVTDALEVGYRHIDTATLYRNEQGVGAAVAASGIPRDELFITTKLWNDDQGYDSALRMIDTSLELLGLDYVDLYLIHWPVPSKGLFVDTWRAFERIAAEGKARSIGVSNFQPHHLQQLIDAGLTVPAVNQVELHPTFQQRAVRAFEEPLGIRTEAWGPLGHGTYSVSELPDLVALADELGATPQQVTIRWLLDEGVIVFPKTNHRARMEENFAALQLELTPEQLDRVRALDTNMRIANDPDAG